MDRPQNGAARRHRTSLDMKSCHRKVIHAPTRAGAWTTSCRREAAPDGACRLRRGCHHRVDRPRAPRNLRFLAGEELSGKVTSSGSGGDGEEIRRRRVLEGE